MKLTATHYNETVSVEVANDDLTIWEVKALCARLMRALGYAEQSVEDAFGKDDE
jgi:hypothetical protein